MGEGCERRGRVSREKNTGRALPVESLPIPSQRAPHSPAALSRDPGASRAGPGGRWAPSPSWE